MLFLNHSASYNHPTLSYQTHVQYIFPQTRPLSDIYESYSLSEMRFNPSVPPPAQHLNKAVVRAAKQRRLHGPANWATEYMATTVEDLGLPDIHQGDGQGVIRGQDVDQVCNARFSILAVISVTVQFLSHSSIHF